jgi:uncharacterized membrane protein YfhO
LPLLATNLFFIKSRKHVHAIITADVLIHFWICLPYGGIQLINESEVNKSIQQNIQLINALPENSPVNAVLNQFSKTEYIKEPSLFSNNIAIDDGNAYPSMFTSYFNFIRSKNYSSIYSKRGVYLKISDTNVISNLLMAATSIIFDISVPKNDTIIILQNYSDNWSAFVDNSKVKIEKSNNTFISIPLTGGEHTIELKYYPFIPVVTFFCSLSGWLIIAVLIKYGKQIKGGASN